MLEHFKLEDVKQSLIRIRRKHIKITIVFFFSQSTSKCNETVFSGENIQYNFQFTQIDFKF